MPASAVTGGTLTVEVLAGPTAPLATSLESRENAKPPCRVDCCTLVQYHGRHVEWLYCDRFGCRIGPRHCWRAGRRAASTRGNPPLRPRARLVADRAALGHHRASGARLWRGCGRRPHGAERHGVELVSVGVDTWGVDWALVDKAGELVGLPHAYRDPRNRPAYEQVVAKLGPQRIYQTTGIQFMPLNTLYSLYAHKLADPDALDRPISCCSCRILLHFWLSGNQSRWRPRSPRRAKWSIATRATGRAKCSPSSACRRIFSAPISPPGTELGTMRPKLAEETGLPAN